MLQCFVFGAANAGKSSLLEGLVRRKGQSGSQGDSAEGGSPRAPPASHVAVSEISVTRGHRQREGAVIVECVCMSAVNEVDSFLDLLVSWVTDFLLD